MIAHVYPAQRPLAGIVDPPSSKNFTTRYALAASLAEGESIVTRPAVQDDSVALIGCLRRLGAKIEAQDRIGQPVPFTVEHRERIDRLVIQGFGTRPIVADPTLPLNPGNAGAVFRMLLAVSALLPEVHWVTDYEDSLGKRPHRDLLDALEQLGVEASYRGDDGRLPITLRGGIERIRSHVEARKEALGLDAADPFPVAVSGEISSQYTSALLFLAPLLPFSVEINVTGKMKSLPLIETTRQVLSKSGIIVESSPSRNIHLVRAGQRYQPRIWETNGDWPGGATILAAAAAVPDSRIAVRRLYNDEQGEKEALPFLELMGCDAVYTPGEDGIDQIQFETPREPLRAAAVNGDLCTDAVLALIAAALVARGETRFVQIKNLQFKECDRVRDPIGEIRKVLATTPGLPKAPEEMIRWAPDDDPDTIFVEGTPSGFVGGITVNGHGDHRVIMMLSIIALRCEKGLRITGAEHVSKSFPQWFEVLEKLGARIEWESG